jgi:TonB family protein
MGVAEVDVEATGEFVRPDWTRRAESAPAPGFIEVMNQRYATQQHTRVRSAAVAQAQMPDQQFAPTRLHTQIGSSKTKRPFEPVVSAVAEAPQTVSAPVSDTITKPGGIPKSPWILAVVAAAFVGVAVWWVMFQRLPDIDPRQVITTSLAAAKNALDAGRLLDPPERSAVHYYSTVLALDPANTVAKSAIDKIANGFIDEAKENLVAGNLAATVIALQGARRVQPDDHRLPALDAQLRDQLEQQMQQSREAMAAAESQAAAQDKPAEARATPRPVPTQRDPRELAAKALADATQAIERGQLDVAPILVDDAKDLGVTAADLATLEAALARAEQDSTKSDLMQLVLQRTAENQLLDPEQDSARHYLDQLAQIDANFPGLKQGVKALGGRLVTNAQMATYGKDFDLAARLLSQARAIGFSAADVDAAEAALSAARKPAASLATTAPVEPKLVKFVQPEYPQEGRIRGVEGWVDLTLAVTASGAVADASIQNSNVGPAFRRAALAASKQWKYEPRVLANATQPVQVRVTFRLGDR